MIISRAMAEVDIELVRRVLRRSIKPVGEHSQRGLSAKAKLDRDAVYDILNGRNINPTTAVLASLAEALGGDLSMFGLAKPLIVSEQKLRDELFDALEHVPQSEDRAGQAQYLASAVARALGLPKVLPASDPEQPASPDKRKAGRLRAVPKD